MTQIHKIIVLNYPALFIEEKMLMEQKLLAINGMQDHIHVLVGLRPAMRMADLVKDIKNNSSSFINEKDG